MRLATLLAVAFACDEFLKLRFVHAFVSNERGSSCCRKSLVEEVRLDRSVPLRYHCPVYLSSTVVRRKALTILMVRNVDLPEAIIFYGLECVFDPPGVVEATIDARHLRLRPGIARILEECQEVGTAALILSESNNLNELELQEYFTNSWANSFADSTKITLQSLTDGDGPALSFRCIDTKLTAPASRCESEDDDCIFYNLSGSGRSPSPAFLLDSLQSIHIDPKGFGGSSGFARGQWVEPRRSPMTSRTVVFIAGDWKIDQRNTGVIAWLTNKDEDNVLPLVRDRCAAARAAGCRIVYLEQLDQNLTVLDDERTISRCDAVINTYGNDNPRDIQPISLDAISTPGDYWLNPPCPRDDMGNAVVVDDVVEWFRAEREMKVLVGDTGCNVNNEDIGDGEMNEDEITRILADLDDL